MYTGPGDLTIVYSTLWYMDYNFLGRDAMIEYPGFNPDQ